MRNFFAELEQHGIVLASSNTLEEADDAIINEPTFNNCYCVDGKLANLFRLERFRRLYKDGYTHFRVVNERGRDAWIVIIGTKKRSILIAYGEQPNAIYHYIRLTPEESQYILVEARGSLAVTSTAHNQIHKNRNKAISVPKTDLPQYFGGWDGTRPNIPGI